METVYIAFLRGINVGGKNIIKMAELKKMFEAMGFQNVQTYIQSGNVLFAAHEDEKTLTRSIEHQIEKVFGFNAKVVLRTAEELERIIENSPFPRQAIEEAEELTKVESYYVALLDNEPLVENTGKFGAYKGETDEFRIIGREVYMLFYNSIRNSKLAGKLDKLQVSSTVRNWKTINKLLELAKDL